MGVVFWLCGESIRLMLTFKIARRKIRIAYSYLPLKQNTNKLKKCLQAVLFQSIEGNFMPLLIH